MVEPGDILRWVFAKTFGRPMNFSFVDEFVAGSAGPISKREVDWLRAKGVQAILSVKETPLPKHWVGDLEYLNVPLRNHKVPTVEEIETCVDFVLRETSLKRKALIHCAAGKGRTGTVIAAYFLRRYGLTPEEAIGRVRFLRSGSIEKRQEQSIRAYAEAFENKDSGV